MLETDQILMLNIVKRLRVRRNKFNCYRLESLLTKFIGQRFAEMSGLLQTNHGLTLKAAPATSRTKKRQLKATEPSPVLTAAQQLEEDEKVKHLLPH